MSLSAVLDYLSAGLRYTLGRRRTAVLVYHRITPELFEAHVDKLVELYNIVSLDRLVDAIERRDWSGMPPRSLVITFDDGCGGFAKLEPVIRRYNIPMTQFLTGGIGTNRHSWFREVPHRYHSVLKGMPHEERLAWVKHAFGHDPLREYPDREMLSLDELRQLADAGVVFGAHTVTHPELPTCDCQTAWREISQSKAQLESDLGCEVAHFAYPSGSFTNRDASFARKAGFRSARTMRRGWNNVRTDPYRLKDLGPGDDLARAQLGHLELISTGRRIRKVLETVRSSFRLPGSNGLKIRSARQESVSARKKPSICFIAQNAYGALSETDTGHVGGIERQQSLMARWFAARGYEVSMVTWDEGQDDGVRVAGVRVIPLCRRDDGLSGLRFFHPRWSSLWRALARADADVYYYNCGDLGLGQLVMWCRRHGRKCVYSVANEPDCDPSLPKLRPLRERVLYRYGLRLADRIIVQTKRQQEMLRDGFHRDSVVIPMPCPGPGPEDHVAPDPPSVESARVLWVGRISEQKRLEWLLDVAERCPDLTFDVVGAAYRGSPYVATVTGRAEAVPNVRMHGRVLHRGTARFYRRASVLCCTSAYEGFPNTFLEAWSHGVPVVSTFDPDDVIAARRLGRVARNVDDLARQLRRLVSAPSEWRQASENARCYYLTHHTLAASMPKFRRVLLDVVS